MRLHLQCLHRLCAGVCLCCLPPSCPHPNACVALHVQVIVAANNLLASDHARSKLPAVELLAHLAPRAEYSSKVADVALGTLALALMDAGPGWAGAQQVQHHAAQAIKALIENIQVRSRVWSCGACSLPC